MSGAGVKGQLLEQELLLILSSLRTLKRFQVLCARNWGRNPSRHSGVASSYFLPLVEMALEVCWVGSGCWDPCSVLWIAGDGNRWCWNQLTFVEKLRVYLLYSNSPISILLMGHLKPREAGDFTTRSS